MSQSQSQGKKRKRAQASEAAATPSTSQAPHTGVTFKNANLAETEGGPVFATAGALDIPAHVPFNVFANKKKRSLLAGQTSKTEWQSTNHTEQLDEQTNEDESEKRAFDPGYSCEYMLAVYDKRTNTAHVVPAPLHILKSSLKAHKSLPPITSNNQPEQIVGERKKQRDLLGTTFGTKKAQRNIRAADRNKVDATSADLVRLQPHLQSALDVSLANLPSAEAVKTAEKAAKPLPPLNLEAESPEDVYPLHLLAPEEEVNAMHTSWIAKRESLDSVIASLPHRTSTFINDRLRSMIFPHGDVLRVDRDKRETVLLLLYLALFFVLKTARELTLESFQKRVGTNMPPGTVEALLDRFTEGGRSAVRHKTAFSSAKLLAYIAAITLHIDEFSVDLTTVAQDLQMDVKRNSVAEIYKSLGCTIEEPDSNEKARLSESGMAAREIRTRKRAVLALPLKFPEPMRKKAR